MLIQLNSLSGFQVNLEACGLGLRVGRLGFSLAAKRHLPMTSLDRKPLAASEPENSENKTCCGPGALGPTS